MGVDLLYLTHNRREFTEFSFEMLLRNTNWDLVDRLVVYDDNSVDGAREEVTKRIPRIPVPLTFRDHTTGSPVAVMNDYVAQTDSSLFAKIDNDVVVPPRWLEDFLSVMEADDPPELLGTESPFMGPPNLDWDGTYRWTPWKHIGGIGLMATDFFRRTGPMDVDGYHGFTGHQWKHNPHRGWMNPDLLVCLLDRCPVEPWLSLSRRYESLGWQRRWGRIPDHFSMYWDWFIEPEEGVA